MSATDVPIDRSGAAPRAEAASRENGAPRADYRNSLDTADVAG